MGGGIGSEFSTFFLFKTAEYPNLIDGQLDELIKEGPRESPKVTGVRGNPPKDRVNTFSPRKKAEPALGPV